MENLHEFFRYEDGVLFWKVNRGTVKAGSVCGNTHHSGYRRTKLHNRELLIHRVIWNMFNGPIPDGMELDHINRNKRDNRIENLRLATHGDNMLNRGGFSVATKTSRFKGVCLDKSTGRWRMTIKVGGTHKQELFDDEADAATAYNFYAEQMFGEFAVYNTVSQPWLNP